ncbi:MAG: DUF2961 domain-containing protein [Planctomycetes bacterium]|nr:DUF2961 domain-containing protein [Planctomycetota bacterium]
MMPLAFGILLAGAPAIPGSFAEISDLRAACRAKPWRTLQASGYDRGGGFYDSGNFIRIEPGRRYVLMEAKGPGSIDRMWFTRKSADEPYELRISIDGDADDAPRIRMDLEELWSGRHPPFVPPFTGSVDLARYAYTPIGFRTSCKVVLVPTAPDEAYRWRENSAGEKIPHVYYQVTYRALPEGSAVRPFRWDLEEDERGALAEATAIWKAAGACPWTDLEDLAGEEGTLALKGPAVIYGMEIRAPRTDGLRLEIRWDGEARPSVSAPLGAFFAAPALGSAPGLWVGCRDGILYSYLPMPFREAAHIAIRSGKGGPAPIGIRARFRREDPRPGDLRFFARAYDHDRPPAGEDYVVLDARGRGHVIGIVMGRPGNMEGDDRFFVDGETRPSIHGTGTEDFFNFAWGFGHIAALPLHGITDQGGAKVCYRFFLPAAVPYRESIRISWEHGSGNEHAGRYSGVVFGYGAPAARSQ